MTKHEKLIISAYTGFLMVDFSDLHQYVQGVLGRSVFTHEFATEEFVEELRDKVKDDFLKLCWSEDNEQ